MPPSSHFNALSASSNAHYALQGGAPEGLKFVDTEEEWVVDPQSGQGQWLPVKRLPGPALPQ